MSDSWYFTHAGLTCGPVPAGQIDQLIATGVIGNHEFVWLDDVDVQITVERYRAIHQAGSLPTLVLALRQSGAPRPKVSPTPDWLADVREYERLATAFRPGPVIPLPARPDFPRVPRDWLDDIRQIEQSCRPRAVPAAPAPKPAGAAPTQTVSPRVTGLDPETGQILDAAVFIRWQREENRKRQQERANQPGITIGEAYLSACKALHAWVDGEQNKPLLLTGNLEAIRQALSFQGTLNAYLGYGLVMQEKLMKHLEFLVENRRKFYRDFGDASKKRP